MSKDTETLIKRTLAKVMALALTVSMAGVSASGADAAKKIKLSKKSISVAKGTTKKVTIKNVKAKKVKKLTVKSANKKIAAVKKAGKTAFKVTGKKAGKSTKVTVKVTVKGKKKAAELTLKVKVTKAKKAVATATPTVSASAAPTASASAAPAASASVAPAASASAVPTVSASAAPAASASAVPTASASAVPTVSASAAPAASASAAPAASASAVPTASPSTAPDIETKDLDITTLTTDFASDVGITAEDGATVIHFSKNQQSVFFDIPDNINLAQLKEIIISGNVPGQLRISVFNNKFEKNGQWRNDDVYSNYPFWKGSSSNRGADGAFGIPGDETQGYTVLPEIGKEWKNAGNGGYFSIGVNGAPADDSDFEEVTYKIYRVQFVIDNTLDAVEDIGKDVVLQ